MLNAHTAVALAVVLYDYALTAPDEINLVWTAPTTYAKYMFLLNRYVVLGTLLAVAYGEPFYVILRGSQRVIQDRDSDVQRCAGSSRYRLQTW